MTVSIHESIETIINAARFSNKDCALSYDDATVLLVKNKEFKRFLSWIKDFNSDFSYSFDDSNFVTACARYLYCTTGIKRTSSTLSANEYQTCINDPSTSFNRAMNALLENNLKGSYDYGNEIFDNGTLEDSSFDIAYDIEQINKILFANPKRIPKTYLR